MAKRKPRKSALTEYTTDDEDMLMYDVEEELEPDPTDKFVLKECPTNFPKESLCSLTPTRFRKRSRFDQRSRGKTLTNAPQINLRLIEHLGKVYFPAKSDISIRYQRNQCVPGKRSPHHNFITTCLKNCHLAVETHEVMSFVSCSDNVICMIGQETRIIGTAS
ncbi:hypothetical protein TNCV_390681 [Trichonephila clavipes]|nr:hypothetical protein TNCV_390681 [Trichonephila clavipes]